jgi:chaperonin cofactor prefoldin
MTAIESKTEFLHLRIKALEKENQKLRRELALKNAKEIRVNLNNN